MPFRRDAATTAEHSLRTVPLQCADERGARSTRLVGVVDFRPFLSGGHLLLGGRHRGERISEVDHREEAHRVALGVQVLGAVRHRLLAGHVSEVLAAVVVGVVAVAAAVVVAVLYDFAFPQCVFRRPILFEPGSLRVGKFEFSLIATCYTC